MKPALRFGTFVLTFVAGISARTSPAVGADTFDLVRGQRRTLSCSSRFTIHTGDSTTGIIRQSQHARMLSNPKVTSPKGISVRIVSSKLDVTRSSKLGNVHTRRTWRGKRTTYQTIKQASNVVKCRLEVDLPAGLKAGAYQIVVRFPNLDSLIVNAARNRNHVAGSTSIRVTLNVFESRKALDQSIAERKHSAGPPLWEKAMLIGIWVFIGVCVLSCVYFVVLLVWTTIRGTGNHVNIRERFSPSDEFEHPEPVSTAAEARTDDFNTFAGR